MVRPRMDTDRFDHLAIAELESVGESVGVSWFNPWHWRDDQLGGREPTGADQVVSLHAKKKADHD